MPRKARKRLLSRKTTQSIITAAKRKNENLEQREHRLAVMRERQRRIRSQENPEDREQRLAIMRERKRHQRLHEKQKEKKKKLAAQQHYEKFDNKEYQLTSQLGQYSLALHHSQRHRQCVHSRKKAPIQEMAEGKVDLANEKYSCVPFGPDNAAGPRCTAKLDTNCQKLKLAGEFFMKEEPCDDPAGDERVSHPIGGDKSTSIIEEMEVKVEVEEVPYEDELETRDQSRDKDRLENEGNLETLGHWVEVGDKEEEEKTFPITPDDTSCTNQQKALANLGDQNTSIECVCCKKLDGNGETSCACTRMERDPLEEAARLGPSQYLLPPSSTKQKAHAATKPIEEQGESRSLGVSGIMIC